MAVRYLYNTAGRYVAFIQNDSLFNSDCQWLGVIRSGNEVYTPEGVFVGIVLQDDRVVTSKSLPYRPRILRPVRPFQPFRPFTPLPRLPMLALPAPWVDLFATGPRRSLASTDEVENKLLPKVVGKNLYGHDGVFLGIVSNEPYNANSIGNKFGTFGNRFSEYSILNKFGTYGNRYSLKSPFNPYTVTPPYIGATEVGSVWLTTNRLLTPAITPDELLGHLGIST